MNASTTMLGTVVNDIQVAKEAGFEGIELLHEKLYRYLDSGFSADNLSPFLDGIKVVGMGNLYDIERQSKKYGELMSEARKMFMTAKAVGAPMVQLCTGPVDSGIARDFAAGRVGPGETRYMGFLGKPESDTIKYTAKNVTALAGIAKQYDLELYIEPVAWTPLNTTEKVIKVINESGMDNVGLVIDFWHVWTAGETPDDIAKLDKNLIKGVHFCDGLEFDRNSVPDQNILRDIWTGAGNIPLKEWTDAIKSTGFNGWYSCEIFCRKAWEQDYLKTAKALKQLMDSLLL
jgi:sugar phosphate isomerase/epimerase